MMWQLKNVLACSQYGCLRQRKTKICWRLFHLQVAMNIQSEKTKVSSHTFSLICYSLLFLNWKLNQSLQNRSSITAFKTHAWGILRSQIAGITIKSFKYEQELIILEASDLFTFCLCNISIFNAQKPKVIINFYDINFIKLMSCHISGWIFRFVTICFTLCHYRK